MVKTDVHLPNKSQMSPSASAAITPHPVPSLPPSLPVLIFFEFPSYLAAPWPVYST